MKKTIGFSNRNKTIALVCVIILAFASAFTLMIAKPRVAHATGWQNGDTYEGYGLAVDGWYHSNVPVTEAPMLTVLTHGLGGSASHWSNNYGNAQGTPFGFAYDSTSLIEQLREKSGDAVVYWAKMDNDDASKVTYVEDIK